MDKKKDNWKKILGVIFLIFLCIFSVFGIMIIFLKTDMPLTMVSSESMVPTYYPGDLLIIEYADEGEIMPLDVIVFWPLTWGVERTHVPIVPVVHRVINISRDGDKPYYKGTWYQTKGDLFPYTYPFIDPETPHCCVIGKVVGRIPYLGLPKLWMDQLGGNVLIYMIIILLVVLLIYSLSMKEEEETEEEIEENQKLIEKNKIHDKIK
ncbi:MAG: hypothetical protein ACTSO9_04185 [Candidatus Helarchaeota archaeon]